MRTLKALLLATTLFSSVLLIHCAGIGSLPLTDRDETIFAEASREMSERSDFIVPHFNNHPLFHKPPLFHWAQVFSYRLFDENEFAARFPSALAAALTALLIFLFGRRIYDKRAGILSAIAFTLCAHTLILSKAGVMDMVAVFFATFAVWAGWELVSIKKGARPYPFLNFWWWAFYAALSAVFLAKGPVALLPLAALGVFTRLARVQDANKSLRVGMGLLLAMVLIGLWGVPAFMRTNGEYFSVFLGKHVLQRSFQTLEGHGAESIFSYFLTLPFYFLTIFVSFFPWSLFLPSMVLHLKKTSNRGLEELYLLSNIFIIFFVFTLVKTKLPHYTFPAFPLLALLFAKIYLKEGRSRNLLVAGSATMALLSLASSLILFPMASAYFPAKTLAKESAPWLKPEMEFASMGFNEPSLVWYFRKHVKGWHYSTLNEEQMAKFMNQAGPRFCVLPREVKGRLFPLIPAGWKVLETKGFNLAKGKRVDLVMLIKLS